jgi:hypothetical protein
MIKKRNLVLTSALAIILLVGFSLTAMAEDKKAPRDGKHPVITEEQRAESFLLITKFHEEVRPLKEDLRDLEYLYEALAQNSNSNIDEIKKIVADMRNLREKLWTARKTFQEEFKKKGFPSFVSNNFGPGCFNEGGPFDGHSRSFDKHNNRRFDKHHNRGFDN